MSTLPAFVPRTVPAARRALAAMIRDIDAEQTYAALRKIERMAEAIKVLYREVDDVRRAAELTIALALHRIGDELAKAPVAKGTRGDGRPVLGGSHRKPPKNVAASLAEHVGSKTRGLRLKRLAAIERPALTRVIAVIQGTGKEATTSAILKHVAGEQTKERREASRTAPPIPDGMDLRIGDCRTVLADIAPASVPLILTDPPYGDDAEPLYRWLAQWASRVLIPGGSLICYTGQSRLNRDIAIFDERLRYWWLLVMPHDQSQRLAGKFVIANFKPVLWYVKEHRRGRSLVPDFLASPRRDKSQHAWGQGDGGIAPLIEHLTEPGELILDPFAGSANWGRRVLAMGRRWIGADLRAGGTETVAAE